MLANKTGQNMYTSHRLHSFEKDVCRRQPHREVRKQITKSSFNENGPMSKNPRFFALPSPLKIDVSPRPNISYAYVCTAESLFEPIYILRCVLRIIVE